MVRYPDYIIATQLSATLHSLSIYGPLPGLYYSDTAFSDTSLTVDIWSVTRTILQRHSFQQHFTHCRYMVRYPDYIIATQLSATLHSLSIYGPLPGLYYSDTAFTDTSLTVDIWSVTRTIL